MSMISGKLTKTSFLLHIRRGIARPYLMVGHTVFYEQKLRTYSYVANTGSYMCLLTVVV